MVGGLVGFPVVGGAVGFLVGLGVAALTSVRESTAIARA